MNLTLVVYDVVVLVPTEDIQSFCNGAALA